MIGIKFHESSDKGLVGEGSVVGKEEPRPRGTCRTGEPGREKMSGI